jgi:hypothetical protein
MVCQVMTAITVLAAVITHSAQQQNSVLFNINHIFFQINFVQLERLTLIIILLSF